MQDQIRQRLAFARNVIDPSLERDVFLMDARNEIQERMTAHGAHIRQSDRIAQATAEAWQLYRRIQSEMRITSPEMLPEAFKNLDLGLTHALYLEAIGEYLDKGGQSRGSYLVKNPSGNKPCPEIGDKWKFLLTEPDVYVNQKILEISWDSSGNVLKHWTDIWPIPQEDTWFENVWNRYLNDEIVK